MRPCQAPAGHRAPGHQADPLVQAQRDHFAFFFAVDQVEVVLHRHETAPTVTGRHLLCLGELPGVHRRCTDVTGLAGLDHVVQGLHGLLDGGVVVPAVDLVQVDVIGTQAAEAGVDVGHDRLA
ncbi:hypothetical protein D3C79_944660 [compost metagenome]